MIAIEGGVLMPESYVLVARNVRAKYAAFLESRLPVISMAAARNANLDIEMFQPGLDAGTSPPTDSLALWWGRTATTATAEELALIGRGSLVLNSAAWKAPVFLSILGWGCIDEPGLLSNGQLRKTLRRSWFQLRAERVGHWSESGWVTAQQFVGYKNDLGYFERLLALTSKEHVPPTLHFVKSLVSGLHAESASFAQQRKGLRALTGRIRGVESAAAMLPADGSLQEIQRAAGVALDSLEVALHIAQTASC
jgi:hypothetical protein